MEIINTIGETLKNIRLSLGLTQSQVCNNVMSQSNYSKVEKGEIDISFSKMVELLNHLDMSSMSLCILRMIIQSILIPKSVN